MGFGEELGSVAEILARGHESIDLEDPRIGEESGIPRSFGDADRTLLFEHRLFKMASLGERS